MGLNPWADVLNNSFQGLSNGLILFIPNLVIAIVIFIIGWLIGVGVGRVVKQVVDALRVDQALKPTGIERVLSRAGYQLSTGKFLGSLVEWFFIIVFLVASLQILGLTQVNVFLTDRVLTFLPHVIAAALILLVAAVIAETAERVMAGSARAADLNGAGLIGKVARYSIWIFAILAALDQLAVSSLIPMLFNGIVIALSLAIGLAFGLGGQATAARFLENLHSEIKN